MYQCKVLIIWFRMYSPQLKDWKFWMF
jgi:hypothetical protein